jgi:transcriptional regulator of acetoin/glycerol metabolism
MSRPENEYPNDERKYPDDEPSLGESFGDDFQAARGLRDLNQGRWAAAEQRFTASLTHGAARSRSQALSVVGVAQSRLFGRRDARGAFAMLQSLLGQEQALEPLQRARVHIVAAFLFASAEPGLFDRTRAAGHAALARGLIANSNDTDLVALAATAELLIQALVAEPGTFLALFAARASALAQASEPVTRCLAQEVGAMAALAQGDSEREVALLARALEDARALGFAACEARLLLRAARHTLDACAPDEIVASQHEKTPAWIYARAPFSPLRLPPALEGELWRLAPSRVTVLLRGGDTALRATVARALHERSGRALGPFVLFDCGGLPSDAVERALFGGPAYAHASTGAVHVAETGTLYVVAIDELPLLMQPRFLRFLDQDTLVRVVVSTRRDLRVCVEQGHFRQDLGERLMLVELPLPDSVR